MVIDLKTQIAEEVSRILMTSSSSDRDNTDDREDYQEGEEKESQEDLSKNDIVEELLRKNGIEVYSKTAEVETDDDPFEDPVITWSGGLDHDTQGSIELNPDNMEDGEKYYFDWRGHRMFVQKKSIGTDKFEIGIFLDEEE